MSKFFYNDLFKSVECNTDIVCDGTEPDKVDSLSYQSVERSVQNFIASGRAVSSLRQVTAGESDTVKQSLDDAFNHKMTVFDRNPYGPDIAEVSMAQKALDAKAKKVEDDYKLSQKVEDAKSKAAKGSGETVAGGVPGSESDS